jgi:cell division protein FtsQ
MSRDLSDQENLAAPALDGEEESPYLRRQKAVTVRRRLRWGPRWVLFFALVVAPVGITGCFLTTFVLCSPRFELRSADDIQMVSNQFVSREEVAAALGLPLHAGQGPGLKALAISLEAERKRVEAIPWVQSAVLTRAFPNRLVVHVVERTPVAFVNFGGRVGLVDNEGVLLDKPESAFFDFPVLTGLDPNAGSEKCRTRLALYQDFMRQAGDEIAHSGWIISEADLSDGDDLKALLVQGRETVQVHFGHESFLQHFHTFLALLPQLRKSNGPIDSVDLRYRNQVVVNPQAQPPAPPAGDVEAAHAMKE